MGGEQMHLERVLGVFESPPTREAYWRGAGKPLPPSPSDHEYDDDGFGTCRACGRREFLLDGGATHPKGRK